jgi:hypothetical protein
MTLINNCCRPVNWPKRSQFGIANVHPTKLTLGENLS